MGSSRNAGIAEATQLTRMGRLLEATRVIQRALGMGPAGNEEHPGNAEPGTADSEVIDVPSREVPDDALRIEEGVPRRPAGRPASFGAHVFAFGGHRWRYRVYEPQREDPSALLPVVVMLHGCKQDSEDFARGTAMNEVAAREGFLVLYPEQLRKANGMGCWNWFEAGHQQRGSGEPAMIAALVERVLAAHGGDPRRVYVAGLSAGGAMAATVAELYPELFAAVGVHSGLPPGSAHDVPSAFTAMRSGTSAARIHSGAVALPTIVFHGSGDSTVAASNGEAIVQRQLAAHRATGASLEETRAPGEGAARAATCTRWSAGGEAPVLERWTIASGPHAWSGGSASGSFTDPQGPSASEHMARFFLRHAKA